VVAIGYVTEAETDPKGGWIIQPTTLTNQKISVP
jgi:hypothetical protein